MLLMVCFHQLSSSPILSNRRRRLQWVCSSSSLCGCFSNCTQCCFIYHTTVRILTEPIRKYDIIMENLTDLISAVFTVIVFLLSLLQQPDLNDLNGTKQNTTLTTLQWQLIGHSIKSSFKDNFILFSLLSLIFTSLTQFLLYWKHLISECHI